MNLAVKDGLTFKQFAIGVAVFGRWDEMHGIQGAAIFLASEASSYVTGVALPVDGGWTSR